MRGLTEYFTLCLAWNIGGITTYPLKQCLLSHIAGRKGFSWDCKDNVIMLMAEGRGSIYLPAPVL